MKIIKIAGAFIVVASLSASACAAKRATANQNEGEEKLFSSYSGEEYEKEMQTAEGEQTNDQGGSVSPGVLQNITDTIENVYARDFSRCLQKDMEEFDNRWIAGTFTVEVTIMTDGKIKKGEIVQIDIQERRTEKGKEPRKAVIFPGCVEELVYKWEFDPAPEVEYVHTYHGKVGEAF